MFRPAVIVLLTAVFSAGAYAAGTNSPPLSPVPTEHVSPPVLVLNNLNGDQRSLDDFFGKVLLVNFWATWCPPCVKELASMQAVRNRLADEPFEVIAVNVGEDLEQVKSFLNRLDAGLDYPVLLDENLVTTKNWKVRALPTTYIIDGQGRARYIATGERDFDAPEVISMIRALVDSEPSDG